jgi:2-keto-4-pentenoate hydratase/2-oxohepta-3-ene-1,7-dioic acid hydratase in catechol pathway
MRLIRFTSPSGTANGILEGEQIFEVEGDFFSPWQRTTRRHKLSEVKIELPFIPRTFYAAGFNYSQHVLEAAKLLGTEVSLPTSADIGYRANNALIAHDEDVVIPADAGETIQYEGELAVVIGKKARNVTEAEAMQCVMGYTIGNDVSERGWQKEDRTFFRCKNADTFKPMGPWIETELDLDQARTTVRLNGTQTIRFATNQMVFGIATFISRTSRYCTLWPGDVMWMGTDGTSPNLKHGDVVEIEISGIGILRNRFVRAVPPPASPPERQMP